jgi:hypothetical protein
MSVLLLVLRVYIVLKLRDIKSFSFPDPVHCNKFLEHRAEFIQSMGLTTMFGRKLFSYFAEDTCHHENSFNKHVITGMSTPPTLMAML